MLALGNIVPECVYQTYSTIEKWEKEETNAEICYTEALANYRLGKQYSSYAESNYYQEKMRQLNDSATESALSECIKKYEERVDVTIKSIYWELQGCIAVQNKTQQTIV